MDKVRGEFHNIYQREEPHTPGLPLETHVEPAKVNEVIPLEAEVEAAVIRLLPHREGRHTHLCAEHFKQWRREAYPVEQSNNTPRMECWLYLVDIVHHMWRTGDIPQELGWTVLELIPKGTTGTQGIILIKTLWKVVEALIYTCIRARLQLHAILHGFRAERGTGTAIMELNLTQELTSIDQDPLFLISLDLRKSYDTMD